MDLQIPVMTKKSLNISENPASFFKMHSVWQVNPAGGAIKGSPFG